MYQEHKNQRPDGFAVKKNNLGEYRNYTQPDNQIIAEILQIVC